MTAAPTTIKNPPIAGTGNGPYSPSDVASEVIAQGGSLEQAWVAAALVTGTESNGTLNDKNPTSTACGLFQFLDTTWASNGGTAYSKTACGATLSQQVSVFLTASSGNNFYPWKPDLVSGGTYDGVPVGAPGVGSAVANDIASLAAGGSLKWLGDVPTKWADAGGVVPANPAPGPVGAALGFFTGGTSAPDISTPWSYLNQLIQDIGTGFGLGWKGVLTIIIGSLMIIVGLVFIFRKQAVKIGTAAMEA